MGLFGNHFVDVKRGTKITYSESDLRKLDRTYEKEVYPESQKKIMSGFRKVPQQAYLTQVRDYAFEKILDNHMYTFQHLLVIPNPYDVVKQAALLLFNSSKEAKIRYRVIGDTPEADFFGETGYTTRHRVPVMGLYLDRSNKVELEMVDTEGNVIKRRMLRIYVSGSARNEEECIKEIFNKKLSHFSFILVSGIAFDPIAVDCNGAIRYSIQLRSKKIGMIPLENGHFLYEDRTANRMNREGKARPCRYHEMDYLGRVYRTFLLDFQVLDVEAQQGQELFLSAASEASGGRQIVKLNLETGQTDWDCSIPEGSRDVFNGRVSRCIPEEAGNVSGNRIFSLDRKAVLLCSDLRKKKQKDSKAALIEKDVSSGEVLRQVDFRRAVKMVWLFQPDILQFCLPAQKNAQVIFGVVDGPELFDGQMPPEAEKPIERIYFSNIRLCDDLFISQILPGRIDRVYFAGKKRTYVQDYSGMAVGKLKVSFAISLAGFEADEYYILVESRNVVHRFKNVIRVVD